MKRNLLINTILSYTIILSAVAIVAHVALLLNTQSTNTNDSSSSVDDNKQTSSYSFDTYNLRANDVTIYLIMIH